MHEYSRDLQFLRSCVFFFLKCFSWFCVALLFPRHATILAVHTYIHTASSSRRGVWQLGSAVNFEQLLFWQLSPSRGLHLPTWPLRLCSAAVALLPRLMICGCSSRGRARARVLFYTQQGLNECTRDSWCIRKGKRSSRE